MTNSAMPNTAVPNTIIPNLTFNDSEHQYTLNGRAVPSVTTILAPLTDLSHIPKEVLARKCLLGTALHQAIEYYLQNDLELDSVHPDVMPYFQAFLKFMTESRFQVEQVEARVCSLKLGYAGTYDLKGILNGKRVLIDTKSVASLGVAVGPQLAAYQQAHHELFPHNKIVQRFALHLKPDGSYRLPEYRDQRDFEIFKSCLNIYHWKQQA